MQKSSWRRPCRSCRRCQSITLFSSARQSERAATEVSSTACGEDCFDQVVRDVRRNRLVPAVECGFAERNSGRISFEVLHAVRADLDVMFELRANISRELIRKIVRDKVREFATAHCAATSQYVFMATRLRPRCIVIA